MGGRTDKHPCGDVCSISPFGYRALLRKQSGLHWSSSCLNEDQTIYYANVCANLGGHV
jgi:hypothetical protein